jgi:UDP-N-acetylmuramyl pentapeptide phosphotransferase/UDP-N-acetylglucosamine-1-phosphate transferase
MQRGRLGNGFIKLNDIAYTSSVEEQIQQLITACLLGFSVSVGTIMVILKVHNHGRLPSREGERVAGHEISIPRVGGMALVGAFISIFLFSKICLDQSSNSASFSWKITVTSLGMFGLGLWGDFFSLNSKSRFIGQLLVASAAYFAGIAIQCFYIPFTHESIELAGFWSWLVSVFWLMTLTNLIKWINRVEGLAAGICLMLMLLIFFVSVSSGGLPIIAVGMAGALLGFMYFNFPPARIDMGDCGAYFLGFLIGSLSITSSHIGTVFAALIAPIFVLSSGIFWPLILGVGILVILLVASRLNLREVCFPPKQVQNLKQIDEASSERSSNLNRFFMDWDDTHSVTVGEKPIWWRGPAVNR